MPPLVLSLSFNLTFAFRCFATFKLGEGGWKKVQVHLTLDLLLIYRDGGTKMKTSLDLSGMADMSDEKGSGLLPCLLVLKAVGSKPLVFSFAFASAEERALLRKEVSWRCEALLRIAKEDGGASEGETSGNESTVRTFTPLSHFVSPCSLPRSC